MARAPFSNADARPRVHVRIVDGRPQASAIGGPGAIWQRIDAMPDAIDLVAGDGAWERPAVIIWEGCHD